MYRKIIAILISLILNIQEVTIVTIDLISPSAVNAENWMCSQDLNGDGVVDTNSELAPCQRTPALTCPSGYTYDTTISQCTQSPTCPSGSILNTSSDKCEVQITVCPSGFVYDGIANACVVDVTCSTGSYNAATNRCEASYTLACPSGYTYNAVTERCDASISCQSGFVYDSVSNKCIMPVSCPSGLTYNSNTMLCEALPSCPAGGSFDTSQQKCVASIQQSYVCSSGGTSYSDLYTCNNNCLDSGCTVVYSCPSGYSEVYDWNGNLISCEAGYSCPSGSTYSTSSGKCVLALSCPSPAFFDGASNQCVYTPTCPNGGVYNSADGMCHANLQPTCSSGMTYDATNDVCYVAPICSSGTFDGTIDKCKTTANTTCPTGLTFNGTTCAATPTCPSDSMYSEAYNTCIASCSLTNSCSTTANNWLCPIGAVNCNSSTVCPYGSQYACNTNNSCTQTGTCSSTQVTLSQYQCPTTGLIYSDQTTCNNSCLTFAAPIYYQTDCTPTSWATGFGMPCCTCWNFCGPQSYVSSGYNNLYVNGGYQGNISAVTACSTGCDWGSFTVNWSNGGSQTYNLGRAESWTLCKTYNACNVATGYTSEGIQYYYCTNSNSITCPSGYAITTIDGKSVCQKGSTCVIQNVAVTKYQCSLTGTKYDTESQCTSVCSQSTSCVTNYTCPLGSQYTCLNNNGTYQCSPNPCVNIDQQTATIETVDDKMLQDDGPRDANGNCLGQIYLFTGRGMRCRPSGLTVGLGNSCCKNEGGTVNDTVGSIGTISTSVGAIKGAYQMYQIGTITKDLISKGWGSVNGASVIAEGNAIKCYGYTVATASSNEAAVSIAKGTNAGSIAQGLGDYLSRTVGPQLAGMFVTWATGSQEAGTATSTALSIALGANPVTAIAMGVFQMGISLFSSKCDQQDLETAMLDDSKYCHYVGDYCEKKYPILGCVQKARGYCCFNSKLARIIHEQGRTQLLNFGTNGGWASGKSPNCRGFTPEEFQMLDFAKIDMSEYFGDVQKNIDSKVQNVQIDATQKIQQFYQNIR